MVFETQKEVPMESQSEKLARLAEEMAHELSRAQILAVARGDLGRADYLAGLTSQVCQIQDDLESTLRANAEQLKSWI